MRKPKALKDGHCDQLWCGLGTSLLSGLQPAGPGDLQRRQLTQRELCGGLAGVCGSVYRKPVYLGAPAGEAVSPGQVCASLCLALTLSLGSCLDVRLGLCIPSSGVYPSVALFIPVSYVSPSLSPERLSCLLSLLVSFFVSLWIGLCMPRSPVALVSLSPRCVSICPRGRVSLPSL